MTTHQRPMAPPNITPETSAFSRIHYEPSGLATSLTPVSSRASATSLGLRISLPTRCFITALTVTSSNAAAAATENASLALLLSNASAAESETLVVDGTASPAPDPPAGSSASTLSVRRAADALLLSLKVDSEALAEDDSVTVTVSVSGYRRAQAPPRRALRPLLRLSAEVAQHGGVDAVEVGGLLGLTFLAAGSGVQAAEVLERAARGAGEGRKERLWKAQLDLLAAFARFEVDEASYGGTAALVRIAGAASVLGEAGFGGDEGEENLDGVFLDPRTEVLKRVRPLLAVLGEFLLRAEGVAVRLAAAKMVEFVVEQVGFVAAPFLGKVLGEVLRAYPQCGVLLKSERAAVALFPYEGVEDAYISIIDMVCRLLPATQHSVLRNMLLDDAIPAMAALCAVDDDSGSGAECGESNELLDSAKAQTLRVATLLLRIIEGDARVPAAFVEQILGVLSSGGTSLLLRRTALHAWDAVFDAVSRGTNGCNVPELISLLRIERESLRRLIRDVDRPAFQYSGKHQQRASSAGVGADASLSGEQSEVMLDVAARFRKRAVVSSRSTLRRLLSLIERTCAALKREDFGLSLSASASTSAPAEPGAKGQLWELQLTLAETTADLLATSLIDVAYAETCAAGLGLDSVNNHMEFPELESQMRCSCEAVEGLVSCFWSVLSLLPSDLAHKAESASPVRHVLAWCVDRMRSASPPPALLYLLTSATGALRHSLNESMQMPAKSSPGVGLGDTTFHDLFRALLRWLPQSASEHAFDLADVLMSASIAEFTARDVVRLMDALCDQPDGFVDRAGRSLGKFSALIVSTVPRRELVARESLKAIADSASSTKQRIFESFPKLPEAGGFSRNIRLGSAAPAADSSDDVAMISFYLHVVFASTLDFLDVIAELEERRVGSAQLGVELNRFAKHAAFCVQVLKGAGDSGTTHREYISGAMDGLLDTVTAMQSHRDGRVRLSGLRLFTAALDVLFLDKNQKDCSAGVVLPPFFDEGRDKSQDRIVELSDGDEGTISSCFDLEDGMDSSELESDSAVGITGGDVFGSSFTSHGASQEGGFRTAPSFSCAASHVFSADNTPRFRLKHEDIAWRKLSKFLLLVVGTGDCHALQREALEYGLERILNSMLGSCSGCNAISIKLIVELWDSATRLGDSPGRSPHALSFWAMCTLLNAGFYITVTGRSRKKAQLFEIFASRRVLPAIEKSLEGETKDYRLWGGRLLETYLRGREMNKAALGAIPLPSAKVLAKAELLVSDWSCELRDTASSLEGLCKRLETEKDDVGESQGKQEPSLPSMPKAELWFPSLPHATQIECAELFDFTLEAFANAKIACWEEEDDVAAPEDIDVVVDEQDGDLEHVRHEGLVEDIRATSSDVGGPTVEWDGIAEVGPAVRVGRSRDENDVADMGLEVRQESKDSRNDEDSDGEEVVEVVSMEGAVLSDSENVPALCQGRDELPQVEIPEVRLKIDMISPVTPRGVDRTADADTSPKGVFSDSGRVETSDTTPGAPLKSPLPLLSLPPMSIDLSSCAPVPESPTVPRSPSCEESTNGSGDRSSIDCAGENLASNSKLSIARGDRPASGNGHLDSLTTSGDQKVVAVFRGGDGDGSDFGWDERMPVEGTTSRRMPRTYSGETGNKLPATSGEGKVPSMASIGAQKRQPTPRLFDLTSSGGEWKSLSHAQYWEPKNGQFWDPEQLQGPHSRPLEGCLTSCPAQQHALDACPRNFMQSKHQSAGGDLLQGDSGSPVLEMAAPVQQGNTSPPRPSAKQSKRWRPVAPRFSNRSGIGVRQIAAPPFVSSENRAAGGYAGTPAVTVESESFDRAVALKRSKSFRKKGSLRRILGTPTPLAAGEVDLDEGYSETLNAFDPSLVAEDDTARSGVSEDYAL